MRVEQTDEFRDWVDDLKDLSGRARILMRVDAGGDKSSQDRDIARAIELAQAFEE